MPSGDQFVRGKIEAAPNAETAPNAISTVPIDLPYQSFGMVPALVTDDRTDEFRGTAEPVPPDISGKGPPTGNAKGRLYPNGIGLFFSMLWGFVTPSAGDGVITDPDSTVIPVGVTRHVWDSAAINAAVVRSAQFQRAYGNGSGHFLLDRGVTCAQLDLAIGDQNLPSTFDASIMGLFESRIADPSITPSYDALTVKPFYRGDFSVQTWLGGSASPIGASLSFTNPVEVDEVLNSSQWPTAWVRPNQAGAVPRLTMTINAKSVDPDDYDAWIANTGFTYKFRWKSPNNIGATSYPYQLWVQGAATYSDYAPEEIQHKLRHGGDITAVAGKSGATSAFVVTLCNAQTSYSSVS